MTSHSTHDTSAADYKIPKPSRLNLSVPPPPPSPPPQIPDRFIAQARAKAEANLIRRETQVERVARVRKLAEDAFRQHQEKVRRANKDKDRGVDVVGGGNGTVDDPVTIDVDVEKEEERDYSQTLGADVEMNLARPQGSGGGGGGDVRIPSRYRNTTTTYTSTFTTSYSSTTDNRGTSSVSYSNLSDAQLHNHLTKEMTDRNERIRQSEFQAERQRKLELQEARYKAARLAQEALDRDQEEATRAKKKERRKWEKEQEMYEEAKARRERRGSTPLFDSKFESGPGTDEDHRGHRQGRGEGNGSGYFYTQFTTSGSSGSGSRQAEKEEKDRERYISRWKSLLSTEIDTDGIVETELSYADIPWPIYSLNQLNKISISKFLSNLAGGGGAGSKSSKKEEERKVLREAIRNFHPDRFNSKVLPRVREKERERVKEGMEICSRVLTDLITENASSK
jgi:hypothetical protein